MDLSLGKVCLIVQGGEDAGELNLLANIHDSFHAVFKAQKELINQVHVENCSFSPHPQPLSQRATVYTQVF